MKRTNLVLDEHTLEEATRLSGEKTYSTTVRRALEDFVTHIKARRMFELRGSGAWEGDLPTMRREGTQEAVTPDLAGSSPMRDSWRNYVRNSPHHFSRRWARLRRA